ncbi:raffinose synthase or seed imbibition protein sip1 domain-containing protein [Hirsutella rhossiliensis]|uniref:Raffinose synthase or seed imbibition protein sip1 domain-containing protein n=1 Tax=Hirsutella rhossiliensis TaxID=111463 RepID=A0A9P8MWS1_9HYPO|nr:raffinose synthase or seed imbibition protein sip1 domain-containing protein [Hirsutella rhossiliensis]KAH0962452.1 raffinose synthase or seed imbibition protein sip1 domain-containing protein [Hirsutella rhossiliensis]
MQFTFKFRNGKDDSWRWIRDESGLNDGLVVATSSSSTSEVLPSLIPDLNDDWKVSSHASHSPLTQLWSLEVAIPPATSEESAFADTAIGTPWGSYLRWFALVRVWSPWLAPRQGKTHFAPDKDAILCSFLSSKGESLVFLAFSELGSALTTFRNTDTGGVSVHARNDETTKGKAIILVSQGHDFEQAVAAVMHHARDLATRARTATEEVYEESEWQKKDANLEWQQNWFDGLGYCTWNALGQKLTEEKVLHAVQKLVESEINITSLIIDDNWQSIDYKGESQFQYAWLEFEAERKHIAVWHALLGYWGGISPEGKIAQTYKTVEAVCEVSRRRNLPLGGPRTVVAKEDVERFYGDFYRFLTEAGIDGVKTDAQFVIDTWVNASVRRELIDKYLDVWSSASFRHFGVKAISCMSQIPQALFHSQMLQNRPPLVFLNVLPDWDMFQTVHDYSGFHAAARCVSGGPIYVTDVPGEHDMGLIGQMTGVTPKGKTIIFRPSALGRSIHPYAGYDDDLLLKVGSHHATSGFRTGILGIFNVSAQPLAELIPLACFPGTAPSIHQDERGTVSLNIRLKALGILGVYISASAATPVGQALKAIIGGQPVPGHLIRVSRDDGCVFEVDIESAWKEMELGSDSGNEVEASVYFDS